MEFKILASNNLKECLSLLKEGCKPFAGGTDLMVQLERGVLKPQTFVNLLNIPEFHGIQVVERKINPAEANSESYLRIGSATTYSQLIQFLQADAKLRQAFAPLMEASFQVGTLAIQNRGTVGGNIMNASPAADFPPALLLFDVWVELTSFDENHSTCSRIVHYPEFHVDYRKTLAKNHEVLTALWIRMDSGLRTNEKWYYEKVGTRAAQAISKVCFAARMGHGEISPRLVMASVAPITKILNHTQKLIKMHRENGEIGYSRISEVELRNALVEDISPKTDIRSTAEYRFEVAFRLVKHFLSIY